ncbi:hypothetical protein WJX73_001002 [Symbiochloris irregularis]|uniref:DNA topoisomerase 2 n=1 Tax=Symbiochloris irregularis TaxID=706552 RepID=A0AAW1NQ70_9CHLO
MEIDDEVDWSENQPAAQSKAAAGKGKPKAKKAAAAKPLQPATSHNEGRAVEEIYQKKTQLEHILLRPDAYVRDSSMDTLRVDIDVEQNTISILNNGAGVPVEIHKEENIYVPELIFGHLLTSSNYDDTEKKVTGGRNGFGAKLTNIFSTEFIIETCDGQRQRKYRQRFHDNMNAKEEPKMSACKASENYTRITFSPDLSKFGMTHLEADTVGLMRKRVYDMAGVLGKTVKVWLNGEKLPVKTFQDYVEMYLPDKSAPRIYEKFSDRWEVCVTPSDGQFQQVSFVNSISTMKGGTHVNYLVDQITKSLAETLTKKNKNSNVKAFFVRNYLSVFVNCMIENPSFDSQTKETLSSRAPSFGSKCELSDKFIKKVADSGVADRVLSFASFKQNKEMKKSDGSKRTRITGMTKLQDANDAGTRLSEQCTLILTEGDSAKALVIDGLSVAGRDRFGVFPLRGKLLNVREANATQITGNAEIQNIKQIMGLQHGKVYDSAKQLRYGHLMIMTDQDHDGSHIKGLIMNFFHHFYPTLLQLPGFLLEFITPIVKATKRSRVLSFYTIPEYEEWRKDEGQTGWDIKYYKGLGTSTKEEAIEYFSDVDRHRKEFVWEGDTDGAALELAFSRKKIEERKQWLQSYVPGTYLDMSQETISYSDFVNKELILFSRADLERSIPSMVDGLKPGQRKILFACFKRNLKKEIKVAQLSGYVSEHAAYHHGEQSLQTTIVGLAQKFVGSNNLNLLVPQGQFGTRLQGGKDAASARYIHTMLEKTTRKLFHEHDDKLLNYLSDDGQSIEPQWYIPVVPLVLINGAEGIGTGWSTFIPNYSPRDLVANVRRLLDGEDLVPMQPWYHGFSGEVTEVPSKTSGRTYTLNGIVSQTDERTLDITELPVRKWTQDYKEFLEGMIKPEPGAGAAMLVDYREHHSGANVHFSLQLSETRAAEILGTDLTAKFKLSNKMSTGNMMLFDKNGVIRRYESPEAILSEFFELRMEFYSRRRLLLIQMAKFELTRISNRVRFILAVIAGEVVISNRKRAEIEAQLDAEGYDRMPNTKKGQTTVDLQKGEVPGEELSEEAAAAVKLSFDYLLSMALWSLTAEKVAALQAEAEEQEAEVARVEATTPADLYREDLQAFEDAMDERDEREAAENASLAAKQKRAGNNAGRGKGKAKAAKPKKKKKAASSDTDEEEADSDVTEENWAPKAKAPVRKPAAKPEPAPSLAAKPPLAAAKPAATAPAKKGTAKAAAAPAATATSAPKDEEEGTSSGTEATEGVGLMDRLAGRLGSLAVDSATSGHKAPAAKAAPKAAAAKAPAAKAAPARGAGRGAGRGAKAKAPAPTASSSRSDDDGDVMSMDASTSSAAASKPKAVRKAPPAPAAKDEAESPMPLPQGKVRRMRPSPFHKGSGPGKTADSSGSGSEDEPSIVAPAPREARAPRRTAAAAATKKYIELSSSDSEVAADDGADSDFEASD